MRKVIMILIVLSIAIVHYQCKRDSLYVGENKRKVLDSLRSVCKELGNAPELLDVALKLKEEAEGQDSELYKGLAYMYIFKHHQMYFNENHKIDTLRFYGDKAKEYLVKGGDQAAALWVEADLLRWEMNEENPESILDRTFKLINDAEELNDDKAILSGYSRLGESYYLSSSLQEALKAFETELSYLRTVSSNDSAWIFSRYLGVFSNLSGAAESMEDYDLALAYCDSIRHYIEKNPKSYYSTRWSVYADAATMKMLCVKGEITKADHYADRLQVYCDTIKENERSINYYGIQPDFAFYYLKKGEYKKAYNIISESIEHFKKATYNENIILSSQDIKAEILKAQGRFEEALDLKSEILARRDSIVMANASRQVSEMYTIYNVGKLEKQAIENKAEARFSRIVVVFLIIVCLFLLAIVVVVRRNSKLLKKKNEQIYIQYKEADKYRKEVRELTLSEKRKTEQADEEPSLFEKAEEYLLRTHCYREPDINRESLAVQIGTNRQYLAEAIHENLNMTFNEYINHLRLEYACVLLTEDLELSIENIYTSAGFNNRTTFYRLFKKKYGLTPKEIRDVSVAEKEVLI